MSTSKASFQQIANSILIKACPFFLYCIAGWRGGQLLVKLAKKLSFPNVQKYVKTFALAKLYQRKLEMKCHGNTELVFFLHRTEMATQQKEARWKSQKININNIKNI